MYLSWHQVACSWPKWATQGSEHQGRKPAIAWALVFPANPPSPTTYLSWHQVSHSRQKIGYPRFGTLGLYACNSMGFPANPPAPATYLSWHQDEHSQPKQATQDSEHQGSEPAIASSSLPTHPPLPPTFLGTRSHAAGQN